MISLDASNWSRIWRQQWSFLMANAGLFLFIFVLLNTQLKDNTLGFGWIRTRIVGIEGKHADSLITTGPNSKKKFYIFGLPRFSKNKQILSEKCEEIDVSWNRTGKIIRIYSGNLFSLVTCTIGSSMVSCLNYLLLLLLHKNGQIVFQSNMIIFSCGDFPELLNYQQHYGILFNKNIVGNLVLLNMSELLFAKLWVQLNQVCDFPFSRVWVIVYHLHMADVLVKFLIKTN